jgi:hypothetical protein
MSKFHVKAVALPLHLLRNELTARALGLLPNHRLELDDRFGLPPLDPEIWQQGLGGGDSLIPVARPREPTLAGGVSTVVIVTMDVSAEGLGQQVQCRSLGLSRRNLGRVVHRPAPVPTLRAFLPVHGDVAVSVNESSQIRQQVCVHTPIVETKNQVGGIRSKAGGRELDGRTWDEFPNVSA